MLRRSFTTIVAVLALSVFVTVPSQADEDEKIPLKDVPKVVVDAAKKAVPGIELTGAEREIERGKLIYELKGTKDGKKYEIEVTADGKVLEVDEDDD